MCLVGLNTGTFLVTHYCFETNPNHKSPKTKDAFVTIRWE